MDACMRSYGKEECSAHPRRTDHWLSIKSGYRSRADDYARNGGHGELGWLFVFRNKRGTEDNFGVCPNDPHIGGKLGVHISWERIPRRYTTERTTWRRQTFLN